jgi:tRNA-intron endonuclease, archaea type
VGEPLGVHDTAGLENYLKAPGYSCVMPKTIAKGILSAGRILLQDSDESRELLIKSAFGKKLETGQIQLSNLEAVYLVQRGKISIKDGRKKLDYDRLLKLATAEEKRFWTRYCVFSDIRDRGYVCKTALKFGADFRVYDRGVKPGTDHAKWVLYPVHESEEQTWHEFAAKNRVAHSTKKKLLIGIVDDEADVTYYECKWVKP